MPRQKINSNQKFNLLQNQIMSKENSAKKEANKALKWIIRSGTAQIIVGTLTASGISYINKEIALIVFATNILSVIGQGIINYLDYLQNEMKNV